MAYLTRIVQAASADIIQQITVQECLRETIQIVEERSRRNIEASLQTELNLAMKLIKHLSISLIKTKVCVCAHVYVYA
jgi:hypothetical protein